MNYEDRLINSIGLQWTWQMEANLFMPESERMHHFMKHSSKVLASSAVTDELASSHATDVWPATVSKRTSWQEALHFSLSENFILVWNLSLKQSFRLKMHHFVDI